VSRCFILTFLIRFRSTSRLTWFWYAYLLQYEENLDLQTRFAQGVSSFIAFSSSPLAKTNPSDKIIKNLSTFVCQDVTQTPIFANNSAIFDGILSLREQEKATAAANAAAGKGKEAPVVESDEVVQARITTRGAKLALGELAKRFGPAVFREVPKLWSCMAAPLTEVFPCE
jgi:TATA-binding protein-associated factor